MDTEILNWSYILKNAYISIPGHGLTISVLILAIRGTIKKIRKNDTTTISWWLRNLSVIALLWGLFVYNFSWIKKSFILSSTEDSVSWFYFKYETHMLLSQFMLIAVVAWFFHMITDPKRNANQKLELTRDNDV